MMFKLRNCASEIGRALQFEHSIQMVIQLNHP